MTPDDLLAGAYATADLVEAAGVTKNVIADWIARDIISDTEAPGRGRDRVFNLWNVVEAVIASNLSRSGLKSGTYKRIISIAKFEALTFNTYTQKKGGLEDFVIVVRVDPCGDTDSMYREGPRHRRDWIDDEETIFKLRVNIRMAIDQARRTLKA